MTLSDWGSVAGIFVAIGYAVSGLYRFGKWRKTSEGERALRNGWLTARVYVQYGLFLDWVIAIAFGLRFFPDYRQVSDNLIIVSILLNIFWQLLDDMPIRRYDLVRLLWPLAYFTMVLK